MTTLSRRTVGCLCGGLLLLAAGAAWQLKVTPRLTQRVPAGWRWQAEFVGIQTNADPVTGQLPTKDVTAIYTRSMRIASDAGRPESVRLEDDFVIRDPANAKPLWQYVWAADVDPRTGAHRRPEFAGDYFVFPRNVEPRTYRLRFGYIKGVPLSFEREDEIEGLATYVYSYRGAGEYTEAYAANAGLPGLAIHPGQEVRCADDQFVLKFWVEPLTGETVKLQESCYSTDYLVEAASGKRLKAVDRWGGETAGDDVIRRAGVIRSNRRRLLAVWYLPALCYAGAAVLFGIPLAGLRVRRRPAADAACPA